MTTIRQIINDAFRESGVVQVGLTPEADEFDEALRKMQTIISQLYGNAAGEPFKTVNYGIPTNGNNYATDLDKTNAINSYYLPSNVRLLLNLTGASEIYLDPNPYPGARFSVVDVPGNLATNNFTVQGNGRNIDGATSITLNTDGESSDWFYRDDLGQWVKVSALTADSESPFPGEFDDFLITSLAMRLNPRYGEQTAPETLQAYRQSRSQFRARYRQQRFEPSEVAMLFRYGWSSDSTNTFTRGYII